MRAHYLQHVPFEGLGSIGPWLEAAGYAITGTHFYRADPLPAVAGLDLLIAMGGPMSVNDEARFAWLAAEKRFIREAVEAGVPVLGVCLGAQLIASAFAARVYPNAVQEIGWFPVQGVAAAPQAAFRFPPSLEVFHWHGETFDLPPGAVQLARSEACENQAFQLGERTIGLQFHLETTADSARAIVAHCRDELVPGPFVQSESAILAAADEKYRNLNTHMADVLAYLSR